MGRERGRRVEARGWLGNVCKSDSTQTAVPGKSSGPLQRAKVAMRPSASILEAKNMAFKLEQLNSIICLAEGKARALPSDAVPGTAVHRCHTWHREREREREAKL